MSKKKLRSLKSDSQVTEAQYLTELLCINIATLDGKDLPNKFWNIPKWKRIFRTQVQFASSLLGAYSFQAIACAIKDKRSYKIHSFRAPWLVPIIQEYQDKFDKLNSDLENTPTLEKIDIEKYKPRPRMKKKNSLSTRLRDL